MKKRNWTRFAALGLGLSLALTPLASAMTVEEARDLLRENYIDPIPEEVLALPTIQEITAALGDPYTYYMSSEEYQQFQNDINDTVTVGIGVVVEKLVDGLKVIQMAPEGPAAKADLRVGDVIVAVDGITIAQAGSPDALALLIGGEKGGKVTITVLRDQETFELTLTRDEVVFPTATGEVVDGHIGWITLSSFGENTGEYLRTYIGEEDEQADRWVMDLRGNPGGYATAAISAAGDVLGNVPVAYIVDNQLSVDTWRPSPFPVEIPPILQEPLIVVVNNASASASELFAAAVRDYRAGLIVGERTYGKGIAQNVFEQEDGSAMKITTNRYYSPEYVTPDRSGVLPNLVVDPGMAGDVARLLSGKAEEKPSSQVLVIELVGQKWYVHKDQATGKDLRPAFAQLLAALAPETVMTLNGKPVTPSAVSLAWNVDYQSRWFDDVQDSPYAYEINTLAALGVLSGDEHGKFDPKGELTRAELASFLTQAMGYWCWASQGRAPFDDVSEGDWYSTSVDILYHLGLMKGNDAGKFDPHGLIDHQQFVTVLMRAGEWADLTIGQTLEQTATSDQVAAEALGWAEWSARSAAAAQSLYSVRYDTGHGILSQPLAELDPAAVTTREEAAVMVYHLMAYSGILTPADRGE